MNERINELADKAIEDMPGAWNIPDEFCKKFARLIVREVTGTIAFHSIENSDRGSAMRDEFADLIRKIESDFGVEE